MSESKIYKCGYSSYRGEPLRLREMTLEEAKALKPGQSVYIIDKNGMYRECRVNGEVKLWKTRPQDIRIPWKYGLREFGYFEMQGGCWGVHSPMVEVSV